MSILSWAARKAYLSEVKYQRFLKEDPYVAGKSYYGTKRDKNIVNGVFYVYLIIIAIIIIAFLMSESSKKEDEKEGD